MIVAGICLSNRSRILRGIGSREWICQNLHTARVRKVIGVEFKKVWRVGEGVPMKVGQAGNGRPRSVLCDRIFFSGLL